MPTILLVDDDEIFAYLAAKRLTASDNVVIIATDSYRALNVLDSGRQIDLVLADLVMPKGQPNGISLVRMAKTKRPDIKVALVTAYRDFAGDESAMPCMVFHKPLDLATFSQEIGKILSR